MSQNFGIEKPAEHSHSPHRAPARYLVLIDAAGVSLARLFLATREQVAEFDGGTEEVSRMTRGLVSEHAAAAAEWDRALDGHSAAERSAAEVYTLDV